MMTFPSQFDPQNPDSNNETDQDARQGIRGVDQTCLTERPPDYALQIGEEASIALSKLEPVIREFKPSLVIINPLS